MTSLTTLLLLPLSLLALYQSITTTQARATSQTDQDGVALHKRSVGAPGYDNLASLLRRRRSYGAGLQAPPVQAIYGDNTNHNLRKREEVWIWMPAHGYIPMNYDESSDSSDDVVHGTPNLMRYG